MRPSGRGWAVIAATRETWQHFRADAAALAPGSWARWMSGLALGVISTTAATVALTWLGRWAEPRGMRVWDEELLRWVEAHGPSFVNSIVFESPGNLAYLVPLTLAAAVIATRRRRPLVAASLVACYVVPRTFIFLGWWLWDRPRPDLVAGGVAAPGLHSYPSGHAVLALAVYGLLGYLWARASPRLAERVLVALLVVGWTGLIGTARVALGTHWPSDVLAGMVIGAVWLAFVVWVLRRAETTPA